MKVGATRCFFVMLLLLALSSTTQAESPTNVTSGRDTLLATMVRCGPPVRANYRIIAQPEHGIATIRKVPVTAWSRCGDGQLANEILQLYYRSHPGYTGPDRVSAEYVIPTQPTVEKAMRNVYEYRLTVR